MRPAHILENTAQKTTNQTARLLVEDTAGGGGGGATGPDLGRYVPRQNQKADP